MRRSGALSQAIRAGLVIGGYQLLFRLGKGGMGEVWAAAKHLADLNLPKLVALKLLSAEQIGSNSALRFFDEAKAASALQHTAIVGTTDLGRDGDFLYIAMDLVRGPALAGLMQRLVAEGASTDPAVVAYIGIQIASALDYAHDRAIVNGKPLRLIHRDVSPQNVLIDASGSVRLTDFGIARTTTQEHKSFVGAVAGKPSYMSPEQVSGGELDSRSDQFSLGIMLHELSCLQRLFGRTNPTASMAAVLRHEPQPLIELVPDFPEELDRVILKSLEKKREDRFETSADMVKALSEASRKLSMSSVSRDVAALVNRMFPDATENFDRQAAISLQEAGVSHENTVTVMRQVVPAAIAATMTVPSLNEVNSDEAPEEFWPTRVGVDALAPSVPDTAVAEMPFGTSTLTSNPSHPSLQPRRMPKSVIALAAFSAVVVAAVSAVLVTSRVEDRGTNPPQVDSTSLPPIGASTQLDASTVQQQVTTANEEAKAPEPTPPAPIRTENVDAGVKVVVSPPRNKDAGTRVSNVKQQPPPPPVVKKETPPAPLPDATAKEVMALIRRVREVDPAEGTRMMVKYSEASKDDVRVMNAMRDEAQRKLRQQ